MVIHNTACTVSAGIGGAHIVGIELREHRAAQHFDSHGTARKCNGGRRCNKITDKTGKIFRNRHIGARLKPFENQTEKIRDQNTDEKSRHRHDHLIDRHDQPVQMASGVLCCENADGNRDNKDHQECDNGDSDGNRNFIADQFSDRHRVRIRGAEISMKKAGYPRSIPFQNRPIQSHFLLQSLNPLRRCFCSKLRFCRISGYDGKGKER